jgi:hypothetical protein
MNHQHHTTITNTTAQRPCLARGCRAHRLASTYSPYCPGHRRALSRNGHPLQAPVTLDHLAPHQRAVRGWMKRNSQSPAWGILADRWQGLEESSRSLLARRAAGFAYRRHDFMAAERLLQVAGSVSSLEVIVLALAVFAMRELEPRRFADDRGFLFVLVRRFSKLAPMAVANYWSQKTRRMTAVYRDMPPRVSEVLGRWLVGAFGGPGLQLGRMERQRKDEQARQVTLLADALEALERAARPTAAPAQPSKPSTCPSR